MMFIVVHKKQSTLSKIEWARKSNLRGLTDIIERSAVRRDWSMGSSTVTDGDVFVNMSCISWLELLK